MRIGELSRQARINVQTIRFYERIRLLPRPARTPSGYRCYSDADLERLQFIRESQQLGFTLNEIKDLSHFHEAMMRLPLREGTPSAELQAIIRIAQDRVAQVEDKIAMLAAIRRQLLSALKRLQSACPTCPASRPRARRSWN